MTAWTRVINSTRNHYQQTRSLRRYLHILSHFNSVYNHTVPVVLHSKDNEFVGVLHMKIYNIQLQKYQYWTKVSSKQYMKKLPALSMAGADLLISSVTYVLILLAVKVDSVLMYLCFCDIKLDCLS